MATPHKVTNAEMKHFITQTEVLLANVSRADSRTKGLFWRPALNQYIVRKNGAEVYQTMWLDWAIEEYNKIEY